MIKIDLHIHTKTSNLDSPFDFSLTALKKYVIDSNLKCIAITNHNLFDKTQYNEIKSNLHENCEVFPGVEVNCEGGHLLLISSAENLDEFESKCANLQTIICDDHPFISYEELLSVFSDLKPYLLIPHYNKSSKNISKSAISKFGDLIYCGEVSSPKKFLYMKKNKSELVPVIFSDSRPQEIDDNKNENHKSSFTYIECEDPTFEKIKFVLKDRNNVYISHEKIDDSFDTFDGKLNASTKLNVIVGKRSTGKSYLLNTLNKTFSDSNKPNIKYLEQFQIVSNSKDKDFNEKINLICQNSIDDFEDGIKKVTEHLINHNIESDDAEIDNYVADLVKFAKDTDLNDVYSKCKMFTDDTPLMKIDNEIDKVLVAIKTLVESTSYKSKIEKYVNFENFKKLGQELLREKKNIISYNVNAKYAEEISLEIKSYLKQESNQVQPSPLDLIKIYYDKQCSDRFNSLVDLFEEETLIHKEAIFNKFCILSSVFKNKEWSDFKKKLGTASSEANFYGQNINISKCSSSNILYLTNKCCEAGKFSKNDLYKIFFSYKNEVLNDSKTKLSGGEKAEFNLLQEIHDAERYDFLLIDELEASFDNVFLNENIISAINTIAEKTTVFLSTHNNSLGVLLKPNKLIYTEKIKTESGDLMYSIYYGHYLDKKLHSYDGKEIKTYDVYSSTMEGGDIPLEERTKIYEIIK